MSASPSWGWVVSLGVRLLDELLAHLPHAEQSLAREAIRVRLASQLHDIAADAATTARLIAGHVRSVHEIHEAQERDHGDEEKTKP